MIQDDSWEQITEWYQQLHQYYQQGQHEQAIKYASQICQLIQQQTNAGNLLTVEIADILNDIGMIYLFTGNVTLAGSPLLQALAIRQSFSEAQAPAVAQSFNNVTGYYEVLGDYSQAEYWYQQTLETRIKLFGETHIVPLKG